MYTIAALHLVYRYRLTDGDDVASKRGREGRWGWEDEIVKARDAMEKAKNAT